MSPAGSTSQVETRPNSGSLRASLTRFTFSFSSPYLYLYILPTLHNL